MTTMQANYVKTATLGAIVVAVLVLVDSVSQRLAPPAPATEPTIEQIVIAPILQPMPMPDFLSSLPVDPLVDVDYPAWLDWTRQAEDAFRLLYAAESSSGQDLRMSDDGLVAGPLQWQQDSWEENCRWLGVWWPWPEGAYDLQMCWDICLVNWFRHCRRALVTGDVEMLIRRHRLPTNPMRTDNDAYLARIMGEGNV